MSIKIKTTLINELFHLFGALIAAILTYIFYSNIYLSFISFSVSMLVDIDHLLEYFLAEGLSLKIKFKKILSGENIQKIGKIYVIFHAWEYLLLLLIIYAITQNPLCMSLFLGLLSHYIVDTLSNEVVPLAYFITYRIKVNFDIKKIGTCYKHRD